ncbi:antibiotic biosynthesis monooxygenase-like protein [Eremomyces bilateralis CBS 781.70]|uniref:Antibiotic biosynthesis monooxygenase-like protein n=1 Tax=Eremomyces bilateralis CBS 781.70 TaxID=1392243 RepID=A0A6G1G092_9PEZI|nr:antibiotic biosynthesis monooxygenase-like protein [Eremomyces bilateralis CBS 781.70]KAF1811525.1 antibiotic biosynthesis monooxygenase-like protein [Eremomyces bilateralis CBS 781.70]
MSETFDIIAILKPKPGKADRVIELLAGVTEYVEANESGTLRYHLQRETKGDAPQLILLERYKNKAALGIHGGSPQFKAFSKRLKEEGLLAAPLQVMFTKPVAGFASRL